MIKDNIINSSIYALNDKFNAAFDFLKKNNLRTLSINRHDIHSDDVFALVSEYETKAIIDTDWESHKNYIDLQYIVSGTEKIGVGSIENFETYAAYNAESDCAMHKGDGEFFEMHEGDFMILYPHEAHMPCRVNKIFCTVKKIVIKIKID